MISDDLLSNYTMVRYWLESLADNSILAACKRFKLSLNSLIWYSRTVSWSLTISKRSACVATPRFCNFTKY